MIKRIVLVFLFVLVSVNLCQAVETPAPTTWDEKHSDESAVLLLNSFSVDMNKDGSYIEKVHVILRIQNEDGVSFGEIPISYNKKRQVVRKIRAQITDPQGKKYGYKQIHDIDVSSEGDYSEDRVKYITMPNVVPGSIIEYEFEVFNRQGLLGKSDHASLFCLRTSIPIKHEIYTIIVPKDKIYYFKSINNAIEPEIIRHNGKITYKLKFSEDGRYDRSLSSEEAIPSGLTYLPYITTSTMKEWSEFADIYWGMFSKYLVSDKDIRRKAIELTTGKNSIEEKIEAITKYIYDSCRYVELALEEHYYLPHLPTEVFRNKFGDCKDQSTLLIVMLKEAGIEAYPVILRDEAKGDFRLFLPGPQAFNHMIVAIIDNDKTYFVDPLIEGYRSSEIPLGLEGAYVLIINGKGGKALQLPYADISQKTDSSKGTIDIKSDGSAIESYSFMYNRDGSIIKRQSMRTDTEAGKKEMLERLDATTKGGKLIDYEVIGEEDPYGFIETKITVDSKRFAKKYGRIMVFSDDSVDFTKPFYQKERKNPLWLNVERKTVNVLKYTIPEGFKFGYIPQNAVLKSDWLDFKLSYIRKDRRTIIEELVIYYKRALIPPEGYKQFKDFMSKASEASETCLIIKKSNNMADRAINLFVDGFYYLKGLINKNKVVGK